MEVTHRQIQEERPNDPEEEPSEEEKQFLKELYTFMKRRDTPIERIPNLGFKQSNYGSFCRIWMNLTGNEHLFFYSSFESHIDKVNDRLLTKQLSPFQITA